jgi:glycosyltransferase involved in cell wall biosynthesis
MTSHHGSHLDRVGPHKAKYLKQNDSSYFHWRTQRKHSMPELVINGRFRLQRKTGIQRACQAITSRLCIPHVVIEPKGSIGGIQGHAWEQFVLPVKAKGRLIWGPANTGPVMASSQILTIHDAAVIDHPEWFSSSFSCLSRNLWPVLARRAKCIVTVSHFSKERLSEALNIPKSKIQVIWNGVDESFKPSSRAAIEIATASIGLANRPYFATLSTNEPRKNLKLVLQAWSKARPDLPPDMVLLVMGGKGSKAVFGARGVDDFAVSEGVLFSGYVAEAMLPPLLSGSQGVLYPSVYEGFGLPILEAMACGVPAVTTRLTSLPEVGGDVALYVDAEDPQDLADTLLNLARSRDLRCERSAMGLQRAKLFTWDEAAARMDTIFMQYL